MCPHQPSRAPIPAGEVTLGLPRPRPLLGQAGCVLGRWGSGQALGSASSVGCVCRAEQRGFLPAAARGGEDRLEAEPPASDGGGAATEPPELPGATAGTRAGNIRALNPRALGLDAGCTHPNVSLAQPPSSSPMEKPALGTASLCREPSSPSFVLQHLSSFDRHKSAPPKGKSRCMDRWQKKINWGGPGNTLISAGLHRQQAPTPGGAPGTRRPLSSAQQQPAGPKPSNKSHLCAPPLHSLLCAAAQALLACALCVFWHGNAHPISTRRPREQRVAPRRGDAQLGTWGGGIWHGPRGELGFGRGLAPGGARV